MCVTSISGSVSCSKGEGDQYNLLTLSAGTFCIDLEIYFYKMLPHSIHISTTELYLL